MLHSWLCNRASSTAYQLRTLLQTSVNHDLRSCCCSNCAYWPPKTGRGPEVLNVSGSVRFMYNFAYDNGGAIWASGNNGDPVIEV